MICTSSWRRPCTQSMKKPWRGSDSLPSQKRATPRRARAKPHGRVRLPRTPRAPRAHPTRTPRSHTGGREFAMHLREFHNRHNLVAEAVGRLLSTSLPDYSAELDAALRRIAPTRPVRRNPYRAAAAAARSGIEDSIAADNEPERAADSENDAAAARPPVEKKTCPTCNRGVPRPRKRVFAECTICFDSDGVCGLTCGHLMCGSCWDRLP